MYTDLFRLPVYYEGIWREPQDPHVVRLSFRYAYRHIESESYMGFRWLLACRPLIGTAEIALPSYPPLDAI